MSPTSNDRQPEIRVVRSRRRKRTVEARWVDDVIEVLAPASMRQSELQPIIDRLTTRLKRKRKGRRTPSSDDDLLQRAEALNRQFFDGELSLASIRYVSNQHKRFGSCTPARGTIRLSDTLKKYPTWVLDYVIVHELAHLVEANHSKAFWALCERYPLTERARGFLMAVGLAEDDVESALYEQVE
ncbi:MAG: M48 family metallopeptidase [Candidatus Poribacteria bacterium]|nr:M48 family metallopeptidase [Candidatus Poribacteria bacterium]